MTSLAMGRYGVICATAAVWLSLGVQLNAQETIYFDDFSGAGAALDGTTPDTSLTGASWAAGANVTDDGAVAGNFTALLPFQPESNYVYTLSADLLAGNGGNNWLALGFTQTQQANLDQRFINGSLPVLWVLSRAADATGNDQSFIGPNTGSGVASTTISADQIVLTLDTTALDWVWTVDFGADGVDRTETLTSAPAINFVGLSNNNLVGSSIDNFQLTRVGSPLNQWNVDGGGSFHTASNWSDNVVPNVTALFGGTLTAPNAPAEVTLNSPASLGDIRFDNSASYTIAGPSTLTLSGIATVTTLQGAHEIAAPIAGSAGLTKGGGGTLTLSNGANSYTGDTNVNSGTLDITALGALNQASGNVNLAAGTTLRFNGDGAGNGANGTLSEEITGSGTIRLEAVDLNDPNTDGLTTEVITATTANPSFSGGVSIGGGKLVVANASALGTADGDAATGTAVTGGPALERGTLELAGVTVAGERLEIAGRQPGETTPHLTSTGTSQWTGPIVGVAGGNQYNIESQSGTLTLAGDITVPDSSERLINLSGAGNGVITGKIVDRTLAIGDGAENPSTTVIKSGPGTWTIATTPPPEVFDPPSTASDGYHQGRTVIEEGTLAVQSTGGTAGELWSRTIEVKSGATFDISSFTEYSLQVLEDPDMTLSTGDEVGQTLSGAGDVIVGGTLAAFDDSTISPGDSVGTLTVNGGFSYSTFADTPAGAWNYELGNSTAVGDSDRLRVIGTATINAAASSNVIAVNVTPVEGTLASGAYTLVQANALNIDGSAGDSTYVETVFDAQGNDITADMRQTVSVANSGNNVVLNVTGTSASLNWAGTSGSVWDVKTTGNWTGTGGPQFSQLDNVTFGNVANKNVTVNTSVAPGSATFDGGAGSTYTVTGSGGMTGFGPVSVNSGTVQLKNSGNAYAGTTTVASGATLEMNTATTGDMVVNGTLSIGGAGVALGGTRTFYQDDFSGAGGVALNGTTPDTSFDGGRWVAAPFFEDDGDTVTLPNDAGGSATFAFTPIDGSTYVVETSIENIAGDSDWFALGFASGQSAAVSNNSRFITGNVEGLAWAFLRGDASVNGNNAFLGNTSVEPNSGLASGAAWETGTNTSGGNVAIRITLDTTGGKGNWTATWEADLGSGFQQIRGTETLLDEAINSVGVANSNANDISGTLTAFSLSGTEPANARLLGQTLTIDGDLIMGSNSTLEFDIALSGQDFVDVRGSATFDGTIDVTNLSISPASGTQYTLLSAAEGINDLGVNFLLPTGFNASIVDTTDLVLTFGLPGDFNGDGMVNAADYTVWRDNLGAPNESSILNLGDGLNGVDAGDYAVWTANFGNSAAAAAAQSGQIVVPEPCSLTLLGLGGLLFLARKRVV